MQSQGSRNLTRNFRWSPVPTAAASKREHTETQPHLGASPPSAPALALPPAAGRWFQDPGASAPLASQAGPTGTSRSVALRSGKTDPRSGVMTTGHGMEMPLSRSAFAGPGYREWGQNQASPRLPLTPAHKPTQGPHAQKVVGLESMKGKWLLFPGRSGPSLSAVGSSKGSEKVTEQGPEALVSGGGGWGGGVGSLEPECCGETRPQVERLRRERAGARDAQDQSGQGFRTDLREPSFFELTRGGHLLGWGAAAAATPLRASRGWASRSLDIPSAAWSRVGAALASGHWAFHTCVCRLTQTPPGGGPVLFA